MVQRWSCDINRTLDIQLGSEGYAAATPITIGQLFRNTRDKFPDNVALSWKDGDSWCKMSYKEYYSQCVRAAKSFLKVSTVILHCSISAQCDCCPQLGLEPMHAVAIIGFNSSEWMIADLGAIFAGYVMCVDQSHVNFTGSPLSGAHRDFVETLTKSR